MRTLWQIVLALLAILNGLASIATICIFLSIAPNDILHWSLVFHQKLWLTLTIIFVAICLGLTIWNVITSRRARKCVTIDFDYLPSSPLDHGWTRSYGEGKPSFSAVGPEFPGAMKIAITDGVFAIDYHVSPTIRCHQLAFAAKYSRDTMIFTRVSVTSRDKAKQRLVFIKYYVGDQRSEYTPNTQDEMTVWIGGKQIENGWMRFVIDLKHEVLRSWGQAGFEFESLRPIRLRGDVCISPIDLQS